VPVIVENKAGCPARWSATDFRRQVSPPTANTLPDGLLRWLATQQVSLVASLPYDLERDLVPVAYIGYIPLILRGVAGPFPANSVAELVALLKANPNKYFYASGGAGRAGAPRRRGCSRPMTGNPRCSTCRTRANAPALSDVMGGQVPVMFDTITTSIPLVRSGKLKALATTGPKRLAARPRAGPTLIEAGVPGYEISAWYMMFAPRKTPPDVLEKLNHTISAALRRPRVRRLDGRRKASSSWAAARRRPRPSSTARSRAGGGVIKAAGIKAE